jgi:hypothetical protein
VRRIILVAALGLGTWVAFPAAASAGTYYVDPAGADGPSCGDPGLPCKTISGANGALPKTSRSDNTQSDTIFVSPGTYDENLDLSMSGDANLSIIGSGSSGGSLTKIRATGTPSEVVNIAVPGVLLQGLSVEATSDVTSDPTGITLAGSARDTLSDVALSMQRPNSADGVHATGGSHLLDHVMVSGVAGWQGFALYATQADTLQILD